MMFTAIYYAITNPYYKSYRVQRNTEDHSKYKEILQIMARTKGWYYTKKEQRRDGVRFTQGALLKVEGIVDQMKLMGW